MQRATRRSTSISRHSFSASILARISNLHVLDNYHGLLEIACHWSWIAASIAIVLIAWTHAATTTCILMYIMAAIQIGGRQRSLADVLHQSSHLTLAKNRHLNAFLGTFLSGYLVTQSLSGYWSTHVRDHHGNFGDPIRDPDYLHLIEAGICGTHRSPTRVWDFLCNIITWRSTVRYIKYLLVNRILPDGESLAEKIIRLGFIAVGGASFYLYDFYIEFFLFWIVPLVTTQAWIGTLAELSEHFPMIDCERRVDVLLTRNRHCSRLTNLILGLRPAEGLHLVHHLFPRLPAWRCIGAHAILMEDPGYAAVNDAIGNGWAQILLEIITSKTNLSNRYFKAVAKHKTQSTASE